MAVTDKYNVFVGPRMPRVLAAHYCHHRPLSVTGCFEDRHRRPAGHPGPGGHHTCEAASDLSSDDSIHCFLHSNFPSDKDIDVWQYFHKSLERTHSIQDGLGSHKLLKTNIKDRNSVVLTKL